MLEPKKGEPKKGTFYFMAQFFQRDEPGLEMKGFGVKKGGAITSGMGGVHILANWDFGYDIMKRRYRRITPGGTITDLVFEARGLVIGAWVGTDDAGATPTDPSGGGTIGNNMVQVAAGVYDGGADQGDGNLTQVTLYVDGTTTRVTTMTYDFRDRLFTVDGEMDYFLKKYYDNLNQVIKRERYDTTESGNLIGRTEANFDDQGQVFQTVVYAVDPGTGIVGNSLTNNFWYDPSGNRIKSFPAESKLFTKAIYDSLGQVSVMYVAFGADSTYADAFTVANNTVLEQVEMTYDEDGNEIQTTVRQRYHNAPATQLDALQNPGSTPNARVTYVALYPDAIGRPANIANFGTNGGTTLIRPTTCPVRSDTVLVSSNSYDATGEVSLTTDPAGMVTALLYDARGRDGTVTENSGGSSVTSSCTASDDTNRVTQWTYTPDGQTATMVAVNARTGNQTTTWTYGTTLTESAIATSNLLRYVDYPDSTAGSDRVAFAYNRQSERTSRTDQRGCVHQYLYDLLARLTDDCVTTLGSGVDGAVRRLSTAYEVRGMVSTLSSSDNPTAGSGSIVNQVLLAYNSFGQPVSDAQSHSGAVVSGTPKVQYTYLDGSTNTIRPTALTYPNGRAITTSYGTSGGINDSASRVDGLIDADSTTLVDYAYLGLGVPVQTTYPQPGIQHTLLGSSGGNNPITGDIYWGLDLFGRIVDSRWFNTGTSADVDRIKYGYDRADNRIWRQNPVATAAGAQFDEFYTNDGLQRLKDMLRGTLNGTNTGITSPTLEQCWTLDPTGNSMGFHESTNGSSWTTIQARTANTVNEITGITNIATPAYDAAGNMTTIPTSVLIATGWSDLTIDDWSNLSIDGWSTLPIEGTTDSKTATYDAWNRLMKLVDVSRGNTIQQNQYDARNFRIVILSYASGTLSETRHSYFSSDWRCIEERVGTPTTAERQFVWGHRYIDDLVLRDLGSQRFYALQDANWNVTSIADSIGTVQERYAYSAYGEPTYLTGSFGARSGSSYAWETLFCSYRYDSATGLYLPRERFYDSYVGAFLQRDPMWLFATANVYQYVSGRPVLAVDPFGLWEWPSITIERGTPGPWGAWPWLWGTKAGSNTDIQLRAAGQEITRPSQMAVGLGQGAANIVNGTQDAAIAIPNIVPLAWNTTASNLFGAPQSPYIPSPNWSRDLLVPNDPYHDAGRSMEGQGLFTVLTLGLSQLCSASRLAHTTSPASASAIQASQTLKGSAGIYASGGGPFTKLATNAITYPNIGASVPIPAAALPLFRPIPVVGPISGLNRVIANGYVAPFTSISLQTGAAGRSVGSAYYSYQGVDMSLGFGSQVVPQWQSGTLQSRPSTFNFPTTPPILQRSNADANDDHW